MLEAARSLLIQPTCPLCHSAIDTIDDGRPCRPCRKRLRLPAEILCGSEPLPWQALASYTSGIRNLLLKWREAANGTQLRGLIRLLADRCNLDPSTVLVPIPSWKLRRGNPLPGRIAEGLGPACQPLLRRTRASVGQHDLNRSQRLANLQGAFRADPAVSQHQSRQTIWLVDDILTTGGTALAARTALEAEGHRVAGLVCLARTPPPGRDLRCRRRQGDTPG